MSGKKMAEYVAKKRTISPVMQWIRDKFTRINRKGRPLGVYRSPNRFPDEQAARDWDPADPPNIPDGVHHKLHSNYYFDRDARRTVVPPVAVYDEAKYANVSGEEMDSSHVRKGPEENFGLDMPTPGFGFEWKRNKTQEDDYIQELTKFDYLDRYDKYTVAKSK